MGNLSGAGSVSNSSIVRAVVNGYTPASKYDSFGRLRVSNPETLFDSKLAFDDQSIFWSELLESGGTSAHNTQTSSKRLSTIAGVGSRAVRQTKRYFNYQPGKSLFIIITSVLNPDGVNDGITRLIGYGDDDNGVFIQEVDGILSLVKRSNTSGSPVDTIVDQSDWNTDKLDGSGDSEITIDTSYSQIFFVDLQWLGVGTVRCGFVIDGRTIVIHEFHHSNQLNVVYMRTANLPVRYEIFNHDDAIEGGSLDCICTTVISEGGHNPPMLRFSVDRGTTARTVAVGVLTPLLCIRLKDGYERATVFPDGIILVPSAGETVRWSLILNPTFTINPTVWTAVSNTAIEFSVGTETIVAGTGFVMDSGYGSNDVNQVYRDIRSSLTLATTIAGVKDIIVLAVQNITGGADWYASMSITQLM